jgi:uncharacterized membrane protein YvbJ
MYCKNCGSQLYEDDKICRSCGARVEVQPVIQPAYNGHHATPGREDRPNTGINFLSLCCFPILGIIMYFVWRDSQSVAAKSALKFGLFGFALVAFGYIFLFIIGAFSASY